MVCSQLGDMGADLRVLVGAGEGNRTLMTSLEGWGSTIELRPHRPSQQRWSPPHRPGQSRVAYRLRRPGTSLDGDCEDVQGWAPGCYPLLNASARHLPSPRTPALRQQPATGAVVAIPETPRAGKLRSVLRDVAQLG